MTTSTGQLATSRPSAAAWGARRAARGATACNSAWGAPVAQALVAAALGTDKRTTWVIFNALLEIAKWNESGDPRATFLDRPLRRTLPPARGRTAVSPTTPVEGAANAGAPARGSGARPWRLHYGLQRPERRAREHPRVNWDVWRPVMSITFSLFIGCSSTLVPTSASFTDVEAQAYGATAACWQEMPDEHTHADQTVHLHYVTIPCSPLPVQRLSTPDGGQSDGFATIEEIEAGSTSPSLEPRPAVEAEPSAPDPTKEDAPSDVEPPQPAVEEDEIPSDAEAPVPPPAAPVEADLEGEPDEPAVTEQNSDTGPTITTDQDTGEATSVEITD